ncbi:GyrI-like domain-containing protein [Kribbella sp. HUAS MG21]|uniref:GyrI-like domain-containing protein n=1 Tax=Kribbella sp. HUAS MG21 TaxID=3160966 RepID=A0AAU7T7Y7_9ACTN
MKYQITERNEPERHLAVTRFTTTVAEISTRMGAAFATVFGYLAEHGIDPAGAPTAYYVMGEDTFEVRVGCEVRDPVKPDDPIEPFVLPAAVTLSTVHVGPYDDLPNAYDALGTRAGELGLTLDPMHMWEEYLTGPEVPPNSQRTEIHWPLAA